MILFFYGKDTFLSREHVARSISAFREKRDLQGLNSFVFDMRSAAETDVWDALLSMPFMAEKKMVTLERILSSASSSFVEKFLEFIKSRGDDDNNIILVWEEGDKFKGPLFKELKAAKYTQRFDHLTQADCAGWITKSVQDKGCTIESNALNTLSIRFNENLWALNNILNQIIHFIKADSRAIITDSDVSEFVVDSIDDNTFHYLDAMSAGKSGDALRLLGEQWMSGKSPHEVVGLLMWQWRTLLKVRSVIDQNTKARGKEIAAALSIHPFVADKSARIVRDLGLKTLENQYERLIELDRSAKTGGSVKAELEAFTLEIAGVS